MSDAAIHNGDPSLGFASRQSDLRARIGWICHALRIAAVLWITWNLALVIFYWSDKAQILQNYTRRRCRDSRIGFNAGLATASIERMVARGRRIKVTRMRITGAGRQALTKLRWP